MSVRIGSFRLETGFRLDSPPIGSRPEAYLVSGLGAHAQFMSRNTDRFRLGLETRSRFGDRLRGAAIGKRLGSAHLGSGSAFGARPDSAWHRDRPGIRLMARCVARVSARLKTLLSLARESARSGLAWGP